jgi:hypothetical protein
MIILKGDVDGFSYFSLISVILFSNQDYPYSIIMLSLMWCCVIVVSSIIMLSLMWCCVAVVSSIIMLSLMWCCVIVVSSIIMLSLMWCCVIVVSSIIMLSLMWCCKLSTLVFKLWRYCGHLHFTRWNNLKYKVWIRILIDCCLTSNNIRHNLISFRLLLSILVSAEFKCN